MSAAAATDSTKEIKAGKIPEHIALIMDGNGRWAKTKGKFRIFGHRNGVKAVREATEICAEIGVKYLTLYAFSTENWNRPKAEVDALMDLLVDTIEKEIPTLQKNNIRLRAIGNIESLPASCRKNLDSAIKATENNSRMTLILALSYSAKWDLVNGVKSIVRDAVNGKINAEEITDKVIDSYLSTSGFPHPELLIRTSGEQRISNFLLWEIAYAELYFTPVLWPDFRKEHMIEAIRSFQMRERRFGLTSDQIS